MGWERNLRSRKFQAVWGIIIIFGTIFAVVGTSPVAAIVFAQAANGVLLPVVAVFLLIVMNRSDLLGEHKNGVVANILGAVVVLIVAGFGIFQILRTGR